MSDHKTRQRWEARRKAIADEFFAGDEAYAETVLGALPYSAIPDWDDVALLMQSMGAAGLLRRPEDPKVHVDITGTGRTCVVKVSGQVIFDGVSREALIRTKSATERDACNALLDPTEGVTDE